MGTQKKVDVTASDLSAEALGIDVATHLESKGFCLINPCLDQDLFRKARVEIEGCDSQDLIKQLPDLYLDGLLGTEGSARCLQFGQTGIEDNPREYGHLLQLDDAMTQIASILSSIYASVNIDMPSRTPAILNETGMPPGDPPEPNEEEASSWLVTFTRGKIMIILCMGPSRGTLELQRYDEAEEAHEIPTSLGTMVVIRSDIMSRKHFSHSKAHLLSCFLLEAPPLTKKAAVAQNANMPPCAKQIEQWTVERMKKLKEDEHEFQTKVDIPASWRTAMNHMFHTALRVAVRGSAARYASTWSIDNWYQPHTAGADLVVEVPLRRWDVELYYSPEPEAWRVQQSYLRHGSFVDGAELFDNRFFGLSPMEAGGMDPHQRVVLEVGYEALHRAGYKKGKLMNSLGGVYLGSSMTIFGSVSQVSGATGGAASINSNRFSFCLGLKGPSMTCDTEGSSSLTAVYLGSEAVLDKGRGVVNEYSLSGGVHFELGPVWWPQLQAAGLLSPIGRCLTWDQSADGYALGDGCGFVVLKKITEMVDGVQVYIEGEPLAGTICSSIMKSSGSGASMHAPNGAVEQEMVAEALRTSGLDAMNIDAVECNGQGAFLSDAVEVDALMRVLRGEDISEPLGLTAVKSRVGHLMECAGIAALQRVLLANAFGTLAPNNHLQQLNPHLEPDSKANHLTECLEQAMYSTYVGVTSRGFGGTNVHVITYGQERR